MPTSEEPDTPVVTLHSSGLTVEVSSRGAELQRIVTAGGLELQWDGDPAWWRGRAPILFPVIGFLNGGVYRLDGRTYAMPKHGFARHAVFEVVEAGPDVATFRLQASDATRAVYPFDFQLDITVQVEDSTLRVRASVSNLGETAMPASFGFHPALRWPLPFGSARADHRLRFEYEEEAPIRRINKDGLLTPELQQTPVTDRTLTLRDELFVDDALIFDSLRSRRLTYGADSGPQLQVEFDDFPILGVWTKPGAPYICIEPWHGLPDPVGFSGELHAKPFSFDVAPGASKTMEMRISVMEP